MFDARETIVEHYSFGLGGATYIHDAHTLRNNFIRFVFIQHLVSGHLPNERECNNGTEEKKIKS